MGIAWRLTLVVAAVSATMGVLEGLGIANLRPIASHETFWEFANTSLLVTIVLLLVDVLQTRQHPRHRWR